MPGDGPPASEPAELSLRPGMPSDAAALVEVFQHATHQVPGHPEETRSEHELMAWLSDQLTRPEFEVWVAESEAGVLGFVTLREDWVEELFVHPRLPARGVGAALMGLVKGLRPDGFGLRVFQGNARARDFYLRHGLVEMELTDGSYYQDRLPDVKMAWLGQDPRAYLRRRIDEVDDELAVLLARRTALTAAVQECKLLDGGPAGLAGRDLQREHEIVERMSEQVPGMGITGLAAVMDTVIGQSLSAWESRAAARSAAGADHSS